MRSGELHYWRVPQSSWRRCLEVMKALGLDTVGTYVPWNVHERSEGVFDFSLLESFLCTVAQVGLRVFIRPGPFIYAEWDNLGIPDHALFPKSDPRFRLKAQRWIEAVMGALRPFLGDPIVLLQADNEIDPMLHYFGEDQGFQEWLASRYRSVDELNQAWGSALPSFGEALPWFLPGSSTPHAVDSARYRFDLATSYARWVVQTFRRHGCHVPMVLNTWPGVDAQHWGELASLVDAFGIDLYPSAECREDLQAVLERLRLLRAVTPLPLITELGCGIWEGQVPPLSPGHARFLSFLALLTGIKGMNWYMMVQRDRWQGAAMGPEGNLREGMAEVIRESCEAFSLMAPAPPPRVSCAVTWWWPQAQREDMEAVAWHGTWGKPSRPQSCRHALLSSLHSLGVEYDFVDLEREIPPHPIVFHAGHVGDPAHLWRYVEGGGHLVVFQDLVPGCARPEGTSHPGPQRWATSWGFEAHGPVFSYRRVPGAAIQATPQADPAPWEVKLASLAAGRSVTVGYHAGRGRGSVTVVGCRPSPEAILAIHRQLGVRVPVLPLTPHTHASLRGSVVVIVNAGPAQRVRVEVGARTVEVEVPERAGALVDLNRGGGV